MRLKTELAPENDDQIIALWLRGREPSLAATYRKEVGRLLALAGKPLRQVSADDIQAFADAQTLLVPATRTRAMAAVRSLIRFAHQCGYLSCNTARSVRLPPLRRHSTARLLPANVVQRVLAREPDSASRLLLHLLYSGQVRVDEACALRWRDLKLRPDGGQITIRKAGVATQAIELSPDTWRALASYGSDFSPDTRVFPSNARAGRLTRLEVERVIATAARRSGLPACSLIGLRLLSLSGSERVVPDSAPWLPLRDPG